jgi:hypothetical protein
MMGTESQNANIICLKEAEGLRMPSVFLYKKNSHVPFVII